MAAATLSSRVMGMVREMVYSGFMGDNWVASAFVLAFSIPNLFRRLLGEGALTAAFIPIFKEKERTGEEAEMWRATNAVISGLVAAATVLTCVAILVITVALHVGAFDQATFLMLRLTRVMFPYMLLICLTAIFMGILNARGHFFIPASGALIMNVVMIASVIFLAPHVGRTLPTQIFGLAIGVLIAGVAQAAFQIPTLRSEGFRYRWVSPWNDATVRRCVRQMIPGAIGVAAFQLNVVLVQGVAFLMVDKTINASFRYSIGLMELPQGVFGISLATYLLPTLSGLAAEKNYPEFRSTLNQGVNYLVFVNLLASILLLILAVPIIRLLFEHGRFDEGSTHRAAFALRFLAPGLLAFSLANIFARAFYALGDTRTPMKISVFCIGVNILFALVFVWTMRQGGLGLANSVSAWANASLLFYALRRKLGKLDLDVLKQVLTGFGAAALVAASTAWTLAYYWDKLLGHAKVWQRLGHVFVPMTLASAAYLMIALWFEIPQATELIETVMARLPRKKPSAD